MKIEILAGLELALAEISSAHASIDCAIHELDKIKNRIEGNKKSPRLESLMEKRDAAFERYLDAKDELKVLDQAIEDLGE